MPSLRQSLFWLYVHTEAKISVLTNTPVNLWHRPSQEEKLNMLQLNWYDFHQIYTLTFHVSSMEEDNPKLPLILSFFFLNPRWYLVNEFDHVIKNCWEKSISSNKPSIILKGDGGPTPASWFLLKQNDPDLLRLIVTSLIEDKIFIPPFTNLILRPLGVTPPIIKPLNFSAKPLNIDPTSDKAVKKGHQIFYSEAMQQQWIFNPPRDFNNPEWQGRLIKPVGSCPNIEIVSPLLLKPLT